MLALTPLLLLAACQGGGAQQAEPDPEQSARIAVVPGDGTEAWRPDKPVRIQAAGGRLTNVSVRTAEGTKVRGDFDDRRSTWVSRWTLKPDTKYKVRASAVSPEGRRTTERTSFATLEPASTIDITSVNAAGGDTYGVGIPIVLTFDKPVYNKEWVERALELRTSEPIVGAWRWTSRQELHFRPKKYWPTGTKARLVAHFDGVRAAKDVYGVGNVDARFEIGDKRITKINTKTYRMKVYENGDLIRTFAQSAGRPGYPTTSGTHVVFARDPLVIMDSATVGIPKGDPEYYRLKVKWTVKFSFSGLYTHSAPWSVGSQGSANVSHGCINMRPDQAKWYYGRSRVGDLIKITGTPRDLEWGNGWTDWDIPFDEYLEGSTTGEPVEALTLRGKPRSEGSPAASPTASPTTSPGTPNPTGSSPSP
ncbi:MAG: L,D-transpeptidase family protein [Streptosporangiales bacterium]|nr:L,D-transpeptidase family protein [Streptosporangiales bacterium]